MQLSCMKTDLRILDNKIIPIGVEDAGEQRKGM
jgi:hypothetical protein